MAELIHPIQEPPFKRIGVLDLEVFFPAKDRQKLAVTLNNLLASPSFSAWATGEPLNVQNLLWSPEGQPRLSILYLAHLSDTERMFFMTLLLNEVLSWVRTQSGTGSLRALLYIDEVFGYLPPVANPPSKKPLLTLLKQARAFGLGLVLATQNPVGLDYKGLSNAGTWLLGRLQTERDKARLIDGLLGVSAQAGSNLDRQQIEATISGLDSREFYLHNVHEDHPVVFNTRWAMSYLCGPLSRDQVRRLPKPKNADSVPQPATTVPDPVAIVQSPPTLDSRQPRVPAEAKAVFLKPTGKMPVGAQVIYRPVLLGQASLHYVRAGVGWDEWRGQTVMASLGDDAPPNPWKNAVFTAEVETTKKPLAGAHFAVPPPQVLRASSYPRWAKSLKSQLYKTCSETILSCKALKLNSRPGEGTRQFAMRVSQSARELRDSKVTKLRDKYAAKTGSLEDRIFQYEQRLSDEKSEYTQKKLDTAVSVGSMLLNTIFGSKRISSRKISRARSTARGMGRTSRQRSDVAWAQKKLQDAKVKL